MHRKRSTDVERKRRFIVVVGGSLAVIIAMCLVVIFTAGSSNGNDVQSTSSKSFADHIGCSNFKDYGGGMLSGLGIRISAVDSGTCYVDGKKYVIYTFSSQAIRDEWAMAANQVNISPRWQTDTSVASLVKS